MLHISFDLTHPYFIQMFMPVILRLRNKYSITVTTRDKDINIQLLKDFGIDPIIIGKKRESLFGLGIELVTRTVKLAYFYQRNKVRFAVGPLAAISARLIGVPSLSFSDVEHNNMLAYISQPMASAVFTDSGFRGKIFNKNHFKHVSYNHLLYLHPNRFKPNPEVLKRYALEADRYIVVRLVSWKTYHDIGQEGVQDIDYFLTELSRNFELVICSENELASKWGKFIFKGNTKDMIHLQAFAKLTIGEGSAMAMESALLGVPSIIISSFLNGFIRSAEEEGLIFCFRGQDVQSPLKKALAILESDTFHSDYLRKRDSTILKKGDPLPFVEKLINNLVEEKG